VVCGKRGRGATDESGGLVEVQRVDKGTADGDDEWGGCGCAGDGRGEFCGECWGGAMTGE